MEQYKKDFIAFLIERKALKFNGPFTLKSGRQSPYFFNIGDLSSGQDLVCIGQAYAAAIVASGFKPTHIFGPAYKGIHIAAATAMSMDDPNIGFVCNRKEEKVRGEATAGDIQKQLLIGKPFALGAESRVVIIDDVITTGATKHEAAQLIRSISPDIPIMVCVALDRQEITTTGQEAMATLQQAINGKTMAIVTTLDLLEYLKETDQPDVAASVQAYLNVYGIAAVKPVCIPKKPWGDRARSVIVACDFTEWADFEKVVKATLPIPTIGGYKVGALMAIQFGITATVQAIRNWFVEAKLPDTRGPIRIIYDHQKAGTDIPDLGPDFMKVVKRTQVDAVIIFPQAGPETERAWIWEAQKQGLEVIVGGRMTHAGYAVSEGGWITDDGAMRMYQIAAEMDVLEFVAPGNKVEVIQEIQALLQKAGIESPSFYSPGFLDQGGRISDVTSIIHNPTWHAIVGRGICKAPDPARAAIVITANLKQSK